MKFENYEVEENYYNLLKKYGITHINFGYKYDYQKMTYDDLLSIEEDCIKFKEIIENEF